MKLHKFQQYRVDITKEIVKDYSTIIECGFYESTHKEYLKLINQYKLNWVVFERDLEVFKKYKDNPYIKYGDFLKNLPQVYKPGLLQIFRVYKFMDLSKLKLVNYTLVFFDTKHVLIEIK